LTAPPASDGAGLYVHVPFCATRCSYCAFVTVRFSPARAARYCDALRAELDLLASSLPAPQRRIDSLYLGGGTPSLLDPGDLAASLEAVRRSFSLIPGTELTLEANPRDVDDARARAWHELGITRVSLGAQTGNPTALRHLGRDHSPRDVERAVGLLRRRGCEQLSLDLIAGLPGQQLEADIDWIVSLMPEHVSVYLLELKEGTALARDAGAGRIRLPDDDAVAAGYLALLDRMAAAGYRQYEISNFARPVAPGAERCHASRHNLKYWRRIPTPAVGLAAHGFDGTRRWSNVTALADYWRALAARALPRATIHHLTAAEAFEETWILGLRLTEGVDPQAVASAFGADAVAAVRRALSPYEEAGLIACDAAGRVCLTPRGMLLSNEVFAAVLAAVEEMRGAGIAIGESSQGPDEPVPAGRARCAGD